MRLSTIYNFKISKSDVVVFKTNKYSELKQILDEYENNSFIIGIQLKIPTLDNKIFILKNIEVRIFYTTQHFEVTDDSVMKTNEEVVFYCDEI